MNKIGQITDEKKVQIAKRQNSKSDMQKRERYSRIKTRAAVELRSESTCENFSKTFLPDDNLENIHTFSLGIQNQTSANIQRPDNKFQHKLGNRIDSHPG